MPGLHWKVLRLDNYQAPVETQRTEFSQVIMKMIWLLPLKNKQLAGRWPGTGSDWKGYSFWGDNLFQNNELALQLLLKGTSVNENRRTCERSPDVAIVDFDHPENNTYVAVSQFKVRIPGTDNHIYPDIILFPEWFASSCHWSKIAQKPKSLFRSHWPIDAVLRTTQLSEGGQQIIVLFQSVYCSYQSATGKVWTITTSIEKHFYRWTDPFPATIDELIDYCNPQKHLFVDEQNNDEDIEQAQRTSPNDQQRLVHGMLKPENLLSIIRSFSVFSTDSKGNVIRIVGRYQQFRAVKKTVHQLLNGTNKKERGGIIWHTQGSGKSLTMVFLIREMWLHPNFNLIKSFCLQIEPNLTTK